MVMFITNYCVTPNSVFKALLHLVLPGIALLWLPYSSRHPGYPGHSLSSLTSAPLVYCFLFIKMPASVTSMVDTVSITVFSRNLTVKGRREGTVVSGEQRLKQDFLV